MEESDVRENSINSRELARSHNLLGGAVTGDVKIGKI
jgi:hypothetical protein